MSAALNALAQLLGSILVGLLFLVGGAAGLLYEEIHPPSHPTHVFLFAGFAVLGALMLPAIGKVLLTAAKSGLELAGPYLPSFGRRAYDNPPSLPPKIPPQDGGP